MAVRALVQLIAVPLPFVVGCISFATAWCWAGTVKPRTTSQKTSPFACRLLVMDDVRAVHGKHDHGLVVISSFSRSQNQHGSLLMRDRNIDDSAWLT